MALLDRGERTFATDGAVLVVGCKAKMEERITGGNAQRLEVANRQREGEV